MIRDDRGVASLEFALLMPMLLTVVGGLLEFGRIIAAQQATRDIIDGAVRTGVVQILSASAVETIVANDLAAVPMVQNYTIDVEDGTALAITVTATYDMIFGGFLPQSMLTFQMTTTMPR